jgi:hypothetical protein
MRASRRILTTALVIGSTMITSAGPAHAAGGGGASVCSFATGPLGLYDVGASIRSNQPFNGDNNPGFAGPGFSIVCRP